MPVIIQRFCLVAWCFVISFNRINAQKAPYLEQLVTINANKQTIAELFKTINAQTSVVFSYSQSFNDKQQLSLVCKNKPLRLVITEILKPSNCSYRVKDKYIIITCDKKPIVPVSKVRGYIYSASDSLIIPQASIYIRQNKHSAVTDDFGFFELTLAREFKNVEIAIAKENYCDTNITLYNPSNQELTIYLSPKNKSKHFIGVTDQGISVQHSEALKGDTIQKRPDGLNKRGSRLNSFKTNFKNISDTLFSNFSLSLLPFVSTNRLLAVNTINKYSLNLLAGYSKGIDVVEIGGVLNIDHGRVKYVQIGGLGNCVFGNVIGVQIAGLANINEGSTVGVQLAGIVNINEQRVTGSQISGIANLNSHDTRGMQLAGIYNHTRLCKGVQLAGIANYADTVRGFQLAGIVNKTRYLQGVQLSLLNVADTASGIPFGFFSYVRKGYHKIELAGDELKFLTISFGTGVNRLHNIFLAGINYNNPQIVTYGYGWGGLFALHKKWNMALNITAQQFQHANDLRAMNNLLSKVFVGVEYSIRSKIRVGFGPVFNDFMSSGNDVNYSALLEKIPEYVFYDEDNGNMNTKMWAGAKLYFKIF